MLSEEEGMGLEGPAARRVEQQQQAETNCCLPVKQHQVVERTSAEMEAKRRDSWGSLILHGSEHLKRPAGGKEAG
jgi:hypothetical protein